MQEIVANAAGKREKIRRVTEAAAASNPLGRGEAVAPLLTRKGQEKVGAGREGRSKN
jgi:hypothetical protein